MKVSLLVLRRSCLALAILSVLAASACDPVFRVPPDENPFDVFDGVPVWRPDGKEVVYQRYVDGSGGSPGIYRVSLESGENRLIRPGLLDIWADFRFSPSGQWL